MPEFLTAVPMLLGMDWMDPNWLLDRFGTELFWISMVIVFVECGLFFPFLPGDTLLFALGLFIATERIDLFDAAEPAVELLLALVLMTAAAFAGNIVGYEIGRAHRAAALPARRAGAEEEVLRPDRGVLRQARQQGAGDRPLRAVRADLHHGGRRRDPDGAAAGSSSGASSGPCCGSCSVTLLGYFLGSAFPTLGENIDKAILVILAFSVIPIAYEWWRHRRTSGPAADDNDGDGVPDLDIVGQDTTHSDRG